MKLQQLAAKLKKQVSLFFILLYLPFIAVEYYKINHIEKYTYLVALSTVSLLWFNLLQSAIKMHNICPQLDL